MGEAALALEIAPPITLERAIPRTTVRGLCAAWPLDAALAKVELTKGAGCHPLELGLTAACAAWAFGRGEPRPMGRQPPRFERFEERACHEFRTCGGLGEGRRASSGRAPAARTAACGGRGGARLA
eukprot:163537-Prymnesium_polylepis.1